MNSSTSYLKMSMLCKSSTNKYMIVVKKKKRIDKIMKNMIKLFKKKKKLFIKSRD